MPNRGLARKGPTFSRKAVGDLRKGDFSPREPGLAARARQQWRDQRNGHPGVATPRTESGLQAIRANSLFPMLLPGGVRGREIRADMDFPATTVADALSFGRLG